MINKAPIIVPRTEQRQNLHWQLQADGYRVLDDLSPSRALALIAGARQSDLRATPKRRAR